MKNLKIGRKLAVGFGVAIVMMIVVGMFGIVNLNTMNADYLEAVDAHGKPLVDTGHALADLHAVRAEIRAAIIFSGDTEKVRNQDTLVRQYLQDFEDRSAYLGQFFTDEESQAFFAEAMDVYPNKLMPAINKVMEDAAAGVDPATLAAFMVSDIKPSIDTIIGDVEGAMAIKSGLLDESVAKGTSLAQRMVFVMPALIGVAVIASLVIGVLISRLIRSPLACLTEFMRRAGTAGDISVSPEVAEEVTHYIVRKDELGECFQQTDKMVKHLTNVAEGMALVARGDLTGKVELLSEHDAMGQSLQMILENLNQMFSEINTASSQVNAGAGQISQGAQSLASGTTEQAATAQELSAAITDIDTQASQNAELANNASKVARTVAENADTGRQQMIEMTNAVNGISEAGNEISKVVKMIDGIAFQTKILSLNATVEAARAGQHGKGFAAVAEEVRNLADRSADAAKETEALVENSIKQSTRGVEIAKATSQSFADIVAGIAEISEINGKAATSSDAQSVAVVQVRQGIDQMANVIQQNSALAEESAASSEELSSQAGLLEELVRQFKLKESGVGSDGLDLRALSQVYASTSQRGPTLVTYPVSAVADQELEFTSSGVEKY